MRLDLPPRIFYRPIGGTSMRGISATKYGKNLFENMI